jgi:alginate export protein
VNRSVRICAAGALCLAAPLSASPALGQQSTPPAAQQQAAVKAPVPNRLNDILPAWLRVRGEFRERVEGFDSLGFTPDRDDTYSLSRFRLNATVTASSSLSFQAQVQDARVAEKEVGPTTAPFRGPFDLRLGFADIGKATAHVAARVGRQELAFGEQRLLGHLAWTNTARSWDAARLILRSSRFQVDAFAASLVRSLPDEFDKSGNGNRLYGAYGSAPALIKLATVEPFVFFRRDENLRSELGPLGVLHQTTTGVRIAGRLPARLDYNTDLALQRGSLEGDSVDAWAGHWMIRESLPGKHNVKLASEYNYATGDRNPADGIRHTFDQLYPTGHDKLGLADQVGWRNIRHIREGFEFTPIKATPLAVNYHSWWLADTHDALYAASGAPLARVAGGAAEAHVGQEIDVQITRNLTPQIAVAGGYAHMFTGAFLEQATPGKSYSYPYVMVTYVFLAEK